MKHRHTPQEKKDLAYRKDHHVNAEYPHPFRRIWPRKKAHAHRAYRRQVHQLLAQVEAPTAPSDDRAGDVQAEAVRRKQVRKWSVGKGYGGASPLRDWVDRQWEQRVTTTAHNFFKRSYDEDLHGERFAAFLAILIEGKSSYSRRLAVIFNEALSDPLSHHDDVPENWRHPFRHQWMAAFFARHPEWEPRLRGWIANRLA